MKNIKLKTAMSLLVLSSILIAVLGIAVPKVYAIGRIYITPPSIDDPLIAPGAQIKYNASAADVANVFTWQIKITYDPAILNCTGAMVAPGSIFNFEIDVTPVIDNFAGTVTLGSTQLMAAPVSGSGVMTMVNFTVLGIGYSHVNYSRPLGTDTYLLDDLGHDIPVTVEDAYFNNYAPPAPATMYIDPPNVIDSTLVAGQRFNVSLKLADATDVKTWMAQIHYTNTVLMATDVYEGIFLQSAGTTTFASTIDHGSGVVQLSCSLASGGVSGSGELAIMTFEVLALGESPIAIDTADLRDSMDRALPFTTSDGYFNNMLLAKLKIEPPEVSGPAYVAGTTFEINVTVQEVESLKTCIFNLTYDPTIIQEIGMSFPPVLGEIPVKVLHVDDTAGYIWASLTYEGGVSTIPPVTIMKVEFLVLQMGVSPINLTETSLLDMSDNPIAHEVYHGIFIGLIRDVAILDVTRDLAVVYQNWTVNIDVTVKNKGNVTETFNVQIFYEGTLGATTTVVDLAPDAETTVTLVWDTTGVPYWLNYTISALAGPVPYEFNLVDNTFADGDVEVRIMGDINGDGRVDMRDISQICAAFGAYPGHLKWDFYADLNQDGRIDMRDIAMVCSFFGTEYIA